MAYGTINAERDSHARLDAYCKKSDRKIGKAASRLIDWVMRQDPDIRAIIFEGVSPEGELALLELIYRRAKAKLETPAKSPLSHINTGGVVGGKSGSAKTAGAKA